MTRERGGHTSTATAGTAAVRPAAGHRALSAVADGCLLGAALMILAGIVEVILSVQAARRSLAEIAAPLSAEDSRDGGAGR